MSRAYNILILGASYGSLLGTKLLLAGHPVTLVCTKPTADLINREGTLVRLPVRGRDGFVAVDSKKLKTTLSAATPDEINPQDFDLVVLGMQEPQYGSAGVRELMSRVGSAGIPCMAIMNMPPLPFLKRIQGLSTEELADCYAVPGVWDNFDPSLLTLASPDPQAFRPPDEDKNVLQVSLPTNFKVARLDSDEHTEMLKQLQSDIDAIRFDIEDEQVELPVKLKVHDSIFVPLAKWNMLLTGNYRCVRREEMIPIQQAVHADLDKSKEVYDWVGELTRKLGALNEDQVPFEKYANAADGLSKPSSAARALFGGSTDIERVDCLVKRISDQLGMQLDTVDEIVSLVEHHLEKNRRAASYSVGGL